MLEFRIDIWAEMYIWELSAPGLYLNPRTVLNHWEKRMYMEKMTKNWAQGTQCEKIGKEKKLIKEIEKPAMALELKKKRELIGQWTKYFKKEELNCKILSIGGERWGTENHWVWQYGCHRRLYKSYLGGMMVLGILYDSRSFQGWYHCWPGTTLWVAII